MKKILECSSKGDKRFSAFYAKVKVFGVMDTIESHYQLSKRFANVDGSIFAPKNIKEAKGKQPVFFKLSGRSFEVKHLTAYYNLLWVKYLDSNPQLVEYARKFDDFSDMFKGKAVNCQADVIRKYIKEGRDSIRESSEVLDFLESLSLSNKYERQL